MSNGTKPAEREGSFDRMKLAILVIVLTFTGIFFISFFYFKGGAPDTKENVFNTLIPLFATWIGTVLAFYFGRENFEAASNRYKEIISSLTPELLDDVLVSQIMILKKTMVTMQLTEVNKKTVQELIKYLDDLEKSRLPVFDGDALKYVIHKSTLLEAVNKNSTTVPISFSLFEKDYKTVITAFVLVNQDQTLESVIQQIGGPQNIEDVFVQNSESKIVGWLTNSLIMRYLKN